MSLKVKLMSVIASFCLVAVIVVVGVFAASSGSLYLNGTVSFNANDILVEVYGTVANTRNTPPELSDLIWTLTSAPSDDEKDTWKGHALDFNYDDDPIVYEITIINKSPERYVDVCIVNDITISSALNVNFLFKSTSGEELETYTLGEHVQVQEGDTATMLIEFTYIGDRDIDTSLEYSYTIHLTDENHIATE